jgi:predicted acetyltransferase
VPELIAPIVRLHSAWLESHEEWGAGLHEDGFGIEVDDDLRSPEGFAMWIQRLINQADLTVPVETGRTHCTYRWMVEGDQVLGGIALRHEFTDFVARMGHVGYGVRPSARRRGLATWALGGMLDEARRLGLERVLVVCEADNVASAKAIEKHGGILDERSFFDRSHPRRYWIETRNRGT